jgi:hypothetical protein
MSGEKTKHLCVHVQVPVVATVIQKVGLDGQLTIQVEPPGPEHESDLANAANRHHLGEFRFLHMLVVEMLVQKNVALRKKFMFYKVCIHYSIFIIFHAFYCVVNCCPVLCCWHG